MSTPNSVFIDDLNGQWYLVDNQYRSNWEAFKRLYPDFEPRCLVESPPPLGTMQLGPNPQLPNYARPIYRNKPRALTFHGAKVEEWT